MILHILLGIVAALALIAVAVWTGQWKGSIAAGVVLAASLVAQQIQLDRHKQDVASETGAKVGALQKRVEDARGEAAAKTALAREAADARVAELEKEHAARISELEAMVRNTPANSKIAIDRETARRIGAVK